MIDLEIDSKQSPLTLEVLTATDSDDTEPDELTFTLLTLPINGQLLLEGDFKNTEQHQGQRYQLIHDASVGVSLSATAGVLA